MIGFKFLVVGQENKAINHGVIIEKVTEGKYLCQFARKPTSCRVVGIEEIQGWNLFPAEAAMNEFIAALTPPAPPADPPKDPPKDPPADPPKDPPKTNGSKANAKKSKAKKKAPTKK